MYLITTTAQHHGRQFGSMQQMPQKVNALLTQYSPSKNLIPKFPGFMVHSYNEIQGSHFKHEVVLHVINLEISLQYN